jgi:dihydroxyacetone kinase DhaKLM complex PTS-EIIA-like component DhaM
VSEPELTPEQLLEAIKQMKVSDLIVSTVTTLAQLGYAKLDESARDLDQARLAIESLRALVPLLEGQVAAEITRDLNAMVANLQLAYASAAGAEGPTR